MRTRKVVRTKTEDQRDGRTFQRTSATEPVLLAPNGPALLGRKSRKALQIRKTRAIVMASKLLGMASKLLAMASKLLGMASKLLAMASSDGLQATSDGLQATSYGLQATPSY